MAKIYLSPAAHAADNPCSYDKKCGENIHCNLYLDELVPYLKACGIQYKRANKKNTGNNLSKSIAESNAYKPDIHYTCHTNAFNGTVAGSRPHVYKSGNGRKWAEIILKHRKKIYPYPCSVKDGSNFAEVRDTTAVAIYEELVFHDNKADCKWFHENMRKMAEYTARAFCEIFGIKFVDPYAPKPEPKPAPKPEPTTGIKLGDSVTFKGGPVYVSSTAKTAAGKKGKATCQVTGIALGAPHPYHCIGGSVYGWVDAKDVELAKADKPGEKPATPKKDEKIKAGDTVSYSGRLYLTSYGILPGKTVNGKFKVDRVIDGRKYGIHIPAGWIEASKAKKVK